MSDPIRPAQPPPLTDPLALTEPSTLGGGVEESTDRTGPYQPGDAPAALPGLTAYVIEGELGRGGMGVVYQARHVRLNRPTALKLVLGEARADSKEVIRFLAEAEAVAAVRHPHVVGVYEFGDSDGRPFLALEFCPGGTLAERLRAGRLDPRAAAELVRKVADGVAAAHELGIVHRDLKPGNVLFDEHGEPKVSDFGLAKRGAGQDMTQTNAVMGTPAYMSPEQAKGQTKFVGPQADVWALGVLLYECLTGKRPFVAEDSWALLQQVMNADPAGARTVSREVPRDLDLICRKCLAKAPHERYASARELADDLGRFLEGKPIVARPAGVAERGWKWARRNKPAVAVMLALAVGVGISTWQTVRANTEADRANGEATNARIAEGREREAAALAVRREGEARASEAKAIEGEKEERAAKEKERKARGTTQSVSTYMREVFGQASARGQASKKRVVNKQLTVKEAMDDAAKSLTGRFPGQPEIEAGVRSSIGLTYLNLQTYPEAEEQLTRALAILEETHGPDHPDTLPAVNNLASLYRAKGDYKAAEPQFRRALDSTEQIFGPNSPETVVCMNNLASLYRDKGDYKAAEPLFRRALAGSEQVFGPEDPHTLSSMSNLAALLDAKGDSEEAEPLLRRALLGADRVLGPDHLDTLTVVSNLAELLRKKGDLKAAAPLYYRVLAARERDLGPDDPDTLSTVNNLALMLKQMEDYEAAEPLFRRALAGAEKSLGPDHPNTLTSVDNLAGLLLAKGNLVAAEPLSRRALVSKEKILGPNHPLTLTSVNNLAGLLVAKGDHAAAEPLFRRALAGAEQFFGPNHPNTLSTVGNLASLYVVTQRYDEAVPLLERAIDGFSKRPELRRGVPSLRAILGVVLLRQGKPTDAEPHMIAGYDFLVAQKKLPPLHQNRLREVAAGLVEVYEVASQPDKVKHWRAILAKLPPEVVSPPRPAK